jgi:hypothetical protein
MGWAGEGQGVDGVKLCRDCTHAAANSREPEGLQLPCAAVPAASTLHGARLDVCRGSLWSRAAL